MKNPEIVTEQNRHPGRDDGYDHGEQRDRGEPREQAHDDKRATDDLNDADKRSHEIGVGNADLGEAPGPQQFRKEELLQAFGKKHDEADQKPDKDYPSGFTGPQQVIP